jgi:hypothetical protein
VSKRDRKYQKIDPDNPPLYMDIVPWYRLTGMSRTKFYALKAKGKLRTIKLDGRRLVDVRISLVFLESLPED